jgi:tRNA (guanine-N7-)-methyltransferase
MTTETAKTHLLASYGRRRGRRLRTAKQTLFDTLLPELSITLPQGPLDPASLFPGQQEFHLEIGFGGGEHLAHQAGLHPDIGLIGCETYINGIAGLLAHINDHQLKNICIFTEDARLLIAQLPDASLAKVYILYPDPWPKTRHHKRRLISTEFLDSLARVMKPGAQLQLATDYEDYATWMLERLLAHPAFEWSARTAADWLNPPPDWIPTRYEQKALAGRPTYLHFRRKG